jgi:hypothetical protein
MYQDLFYVIVQYIDDDKIRFLNKFIKDIYQRYYKKEYLFASVYSNLLKNDIKPDTFDKEIKKLEQTYKINYLLSKIKTILNDNFNDHYHEFPILKEYINELHIDIDDYVCVYNNYDNIRYTCNHIFGRYVKTNGLYFEFFYGPYEDRHEFEFSLVHMISLIIMISINDICVKLNMQIDSNLVGLEFDIVALRTNFSPIDEYINRYINNDDNCKTLYNFIKKVRPFSKIFHYDDDSVVNMDTYIMNKIEKSTT